MAKQFSKMIGLLALAGASPSYAQFSPKDLSDLQSRISSAGAAQEAVSSGRSGESVATPGVVADLSSAAGICEAARQANTVGAAFLLTNTDLGALRISAQSLTPDTKDQFETVAQYDARQFARRAAWAQRNQFFVLPTPINSGTDVYNAETQIYVLGPSGGLELKPGGWDDRYGLGSGFVVIDITGKFAQIETKMEPQSAREFFAQSGNHEVVYVVQPAPPYFQREPSSFRERHHLLTSITCRFVRRKTDQKVLYFSSP